MDRRYFLAAAGLASLAGPVLAQSGVTNVGRARIAATRSSPLNAGSTIFATPAVRTLLESSTSDGELARVWLRFMKGIAGMDGLTVDDVVTPDVRCIELELAGMGGGIETLRQFRGMMNGSLADQFTLLEEMLISPAQQLTEVRLHVGGKHVGEMLGVPASGRELTYDVHTLNLFKGGKMALRWDRSNLVERVQALAA